MKSASANGSALNLVSLPRKLGLMAAFALVAVSTALALKSREVLLLLQLPASSVEVVLVEWTPPPDEMTAPVLEIRLRTNIHPGVYVCQLIEPANPWISHGVRYWVAARGRPARMAWRQPLDFQAAHRVRLWCAATETMPDKAPEVLP